MTTFRFIDAEKAFFPIALMARVLGVSRSGYYRWVRAAPSKTALQQQRLAAEIRDIHAEHKGRYGSPRIHRELTARGHCNGHNQVARLMAQQGLAGWRPKRFRKTTDSRHTSRIAPNLLERDFSADAPNRVWVGDITYIPTRQGWLYLAVLLDLFSRRVVGWSMSEVIDAVLALSALDMAVAARRPAPGIIHHTDRDCRYASDDYQTALRRIGAKTSMSGKADCWDNAVAESFFASLEKEVLDDELFLSREVARYVIADYIENYYNQKRRHSYLDYISPIEYELRAA